MLMRSLESASNAPVDKRGKKDKFVPMIKKDVHERLKLGDEPAIRGPLGKSPYKKNMFGHNALIDVGSDIMPPYQLFEHALADPVNRTLFANVTKADIFLRREFGAHWRLCVVRTLGVRSATHTPGEPVQWVMPTRTLDACPCPACVCAR
ncbi:hypothetical protein BC834DRAFT_46432 [Gloeopeniophorella convolvens]|nr:hypothetical protein BC834DRAFT_46432 [Gloeopeniophorella convolvens]